MSYAPSLAAEYRTKAETLHRQASETKSAPHRDILVHMAQLYRVLAESEERIEALGAHPRSS